MSLKGRGDLSARLLSRTGLLALPFALLGLVLAGGAAADPTPSIASVQKTVDALQHDAEVATEKYNATVIQLKGVNVMADAAKARLERQRHNVEVARKALGKLAVETYKAGDLQTLSLFLDDDPKSALSAGGLMTRLTDRQAQAVDRLSAEQTELAQDQAAVSAQQKRLGEASTQLGSLKQQVNDKLAAARAVLNKLKGADRAALLRVSTTLDRDALTSLGVEVPASGALTCDAVNIDYPSARVKTVLDFACAQLGKPYLWGGDGPDRFDCSGLTMEAWAKVGVALEHNAAMQMSDGTRVSLDALQAGDLIFFHNPASHEGIYLGKGLMIHAPHTGDVVKIAPARLSTASGAVRL